MDWRAREVGLRIGGHRGDPESAPENTIAAFEAALAAGVDYVETDVQRTADGVLVLLHDDTVDRTTDGSGPVAQLRAEEIFALDAGSWFAPRFRGERVVSADAFLRWVCEQRARAAEIDIKARGIGTELAERIAGSPARARVALCSFLPDELRAAKRVVPEVPCFLILEELPRDPISSLEVCGADGADMPWEWWDEELVARMRRRGLGIMGSTANDARSIEQLVRIGADFVDSDCPRTAIAAREALVAQ